MFSFIRGLKKRTSSRRRIYRREKGEESMNITHFTHNRELLAAFGPPRLSLFVVISIVTFLTISRVESAPVTFRFDATVGPPRQSFDGFVPPGWNISLQQGDTISGTFTFEPFDAAPDTYKTTLVQPFDFSIHIKSRTLTTSQYGIEVSNNIWIESDSIGVDTSGPRDRISLACSAGADTPSCIPASVAAPEVLDWTFLLGIEGDSSVLDGADISADPSAWRQFDARSILVTFTDNGAHRSYGFQATPTSIDAIAEPASSLLLFLASALMVLFRNRAVR